VRRSKSTTQIAQIAQIAQKDSMSIHSPSLQRPEGTVGTASGRIGFPRSFPFSTALVRRYLLWVGTLSAQSAKSAQSASCCSSAEPVHALVVYDKSLWRDDDEDSSSPASGHPARNDNRRSE
jgi:hypothetical protein